MYIKDAIIYNRRTKCEMVIVYAASAVCVLICLFSDIVFKVSKS